MLGVALNRCGLLENQILEFVLGSTWGRFTEVKKRQRKQKIAIKSRSKLTKKKLILWTILFVAGLLAVMYLLEINRFIYDVTALLIGRGESSPQFQEWDFARIILL